MSAVGKLARLAQMSRGFATSALRRSEDHGGYPGANLPFQIKNRYRLTLNFILFFGSGFAAPFLVLRHQLLKG